MEEQLELVALTLPFNLKLLLMVTFWKYHIDNENTHLFFYLCHLF